MARNSVCPDDQSEGSDCWSKGSKEQFRGLRSIQRTEGKPEGSEDQLKRSDDQPRKSDDQSEGSDGKSEGSRPIGGPIRGG